MKFVLKSPLSRRNLDTEVRHCFCTSVPDKSQSNRKSDSCSAEVLSSNLISLQTQSGNTRQGLLLMDLPLDVTVVPTPKAGLWPRFLRGPHAPHFLLLCTQPWVLLHSVIH